MSGFTKTTHKLISDISKGRTISPIPPTLDATLNTQAGMSAPIFDKASKEGIRCLLLFVINLITAAASAEPPPKPAPIGRFFSRLIEKRSVSPFPNSFNACNIEFSRTFIDLENSPVNVTTFFNERLKNSLSNTSVKTTMLSRAW